MTYWITGIVGAVGLFLFYLKIRKHAQKDLLSDIEIKQSSDALKRINEVRERESIINDEFSRDKDFLVKNNIVDWPSSGVIELPKDRHKPVKST